MSWRRCARPGPHPRGVCRAGGVGPAFDDRNRDASPGASTSPARRTDRSGRSSTGLYEPAGAARASVLRTRPLLDVGAAVGGYAPGPGGPEAMRTEAIKESAVVRTRVR
ncbi:hypothetical protein GCM10023205_46220 [Yinghuangia aomiensis]|uniref:Uncharacterized protein n=1 Tax=Yinghuangia aomiensis TaxID=676205 RepID=A0ABP9HN57_9ACTN